MSDLEYLKQFREIREIADIIHDIDGLDSLVNKNDWISVDRRLQELSEKYIVEKVAFNLANPVPPQTIQQSAMNCRRFLIGHGMEKVAEMALKHREKNQDVY